MQFSLQIQKYRNAWGQQWTLTQSLIFLGNEQNIFFPFLTIFLSDIHKSLKVIGSSIMHLPRITHHWAPLLCPLLKAPLSPFHCPSSPLALKDFQHLSIPSFFSLICRWSLAISPTCFEQLLGCLPGVVLEVARFQKDRNGELLFFYFFIFSAFLNFKRFWYPSSCDLSWILVSVLGRDKWRQILMFLVGFRSIQSNHHFFFLFLLWKSSLLVGNVSFTDLRLQYYCLGVLTEYHVVEFLKISCISLDWFYFV